MTRTEADDTTLAALLERRRGDDSIGVVADDRRWTWAEVVSEASRWATVIDGRVGAGRGGVRHVGVLLDNTPEYLFTLFGSAMAGTTLVGLNTTRRGAELALDIAHTDCAVVLVDEANAAVLDEALSAHGPRDEAGPDVPVVRVDDEAWHIAVADATPVENPADLDRTTPLLLIFTSGSTGSPKAVVMSNGRAASMAAGSTWFGPDDVLYCAMPLFHGNALNAIVFPAIGSGATIALRGRFSATRFIDDLRDYGATFFTSVGRAISYVLATPERDDDTDHSVKYALAPESSPADIRHFRERFGIVCIGGYGSSENAVVMVPAPGMPKDALGLPREGLDAAVVDPETFEECPRASVDEHGRITNAEEAIGEIVGRNVADGFEGYYKNPDADAERRRNGWYWTGDLGYRDTDGFFYFAGRQGELIRVDSENFAAAPVERILGRFPGAAAVSVYGVPDERTADDQVMAAIEMAPDAVFDPASFERFLAGQRDLGAKWSPRYVRVGPLPVGATNKIDRKRLQRERWYTDADLFWRPERSGGYVEMTASDLTALEQRFESHGRSIDRA